MKKQTIVILAILSLVIVFVIIAQYQLSQKSKVSLPESAVREIISIEEAFQKATATPVERFVFVSIDFGDGNIVSDQVEAGNAYDALKILAGEKGLTIEVKEYKYGIMVERIGEKTNSSGFSWKYFVNGEEGRVAPNLYAVRVKDKVEWRYIKN